MFEEKYAVVMPRNNTDGYTSINKDGILDLLTEEEIKNIDKRYLPFKIKIDDLV